MSNKYIISNLHRNQKWKRKERKDMFFKKKVILADFVAYIQKRKYHKMWCQKYFIEMNKSEKFLYIFVFGKIAEKIYAFYF